MPRSSGSSAARCWLHEKHWGEPHGRLRAAIRLRKNRLDIHLDQHQPVILAVTREIHTGERLQMQRGEGPSIPQFEFEQRTAVYAHPSGDIIMTRGQLDVSGCDRTTPSCGQLVGCNIEIGIAGNPSP